jgi:hypothetical protein
MAERWYNLVIDWGGGLQSASITSSFTPEEKRRFPLNRRPSGPQSRSGHFGEGISRPCQESNYDSSDAHLVAMPNKLYRLRLGMCMKKILFHIIPNSSVSDLHEVALINIKLQLTPCLIQLHYMKACGGIEV